MEIFLQALMSGILIGGVYALIGIGLTIIFGVMRVINFAHGDLLMVGMYATFFLFTLGKIDPFVSILIVIPLMFLFGALLQKVFINKILGALPQNQILLTIGLGLIMSNAVMLAFTSDYKILSTTYSSSSMKLLGRWNWWAPAPMVRWWERYGFREESAEVRDEQDPGPGRPRELVGADH